MVLHWWEVARIETVDHGIKLPGLRKYVRLATIGKRSLRQDLLDLGSVVLMVDFTGCSSRKWSHLARKNNGSDVNIKDIFTDWGCPSLIMRKVVCKIWFQSTSTLKLHEIFINALTIPPMCSTESERKYCFKSSHGDTTSQGSHWIYVKFSTLGSFFFIAPCTDERHLVHQLSNFA